MGDSFSGCPLRLAIRHLFNADLAASRALLEEYVAAKPEDPLGYSLSAAVPFYNLVADQLRSHYGNSLRGMILGKKIALSAGLRQLLSDNLHRAETQAKSDLAANPRDANAMFALCVAEGVDRDVMALVFKRWMASFEYAQAATLHARQLLDLDANAYDAYFVIGFSEHLIQEIPAIFRPFTTIPGIVGQNSRAIQFLEAAARAGNYFQEFARQMLVTVYDEEGREQDALQMLTGLMNDFPGNEVYRAEWTKLARY